MNQWPMTRGRRVELLVGPILSTIILAPLLMAIAFFTIIGPKPDIPVDISFIIVYWLLGFLSLGGLVAIFSLWRVTLLGPERINQHPSARRFTIISGLIGLASIIAGDLVMLGITTSWAVYFSLSIAFLGPFLVWLRHLPRLLWGTK